MPSRQYLRSLRRRSPSFHKHPSEMTPKPSRTHQLISIQNWEKLRHHFDAVDHTKHASQGESAEYHRCGQCGQTDLHLACRLRAPLDIVKTLDRIDSEAVQQLNNVDQTPLHLAAAWGASPSVVTFLLARYASAASMKDLRGRTPLHMSCESCWFDEDYRALASEPAKGPLLCVVRALWKAAPLAVGEKDEDGASPMALAVQHDVDHKVLEFLRQASEHVRRETKERGGSKLNRNARKEELSKSEENAGDKHLQHTIKKHKTKMTAHHPLDTAPVSSGMLRRISSAA